MIIVLSPSQKFAEHLKGIVAGSQPLHHRWDAGWTSAQPIEVVRACDNPVPDIVVIGPGVAAEVAIEWAGAFDREHPEVGRLVVAPATPELLMGAMNAGVREVVTPDASEQKLSEAIERLSSASARLRTARPSEASSLPTNRVRTVLSAKGGSGKTVVATNLAMGLAEIAPGRVCLVDLDLQFGDCASTMNLEPEQTLADAALNASVLDATTLKVFLTPHPAGLFLMAPPQSLVDASEITSTQVKSIVDLLAGIFDYLVIDTSSGIDDHAITAMEQSTDVVLVTSSEVPAVRAMRRQVETLETVGLTRPKRHFVVNRAGTRVGLRTADIEQTVGIEADVEIPSSRTVVVSTNQGNPIIVSAPRDPAGRAMQELVGRFVPDEGDSRDKRSKKGRR